MHLLIYTQRYLLFISKNLFLCLQVLTISDLLFKVAISLLYTMKYFSRMHRLHLLDVLLYGFAVPTTFQEILYSLLSAFNLHMYLLNSVAFFNLSFTNDCLWLLYRVLNSVSVTPMYVSVGFPSADTSAWYTTAF